MHRIKRLQERCKVTASITINGQRDCYRTAKEEIELRRQLDDDFELDPEVEKIMIETDTMIDIHFYPDTPVGFFEVLHYDIDKALDEVVLILNEI